MRTLEQALSDHELVVLRVIGEWWEQDLTGADKPACVKTLAQTLGQLDLPLEAGYMPLEESEALNTLAQEGGRMAVAAFSRQHGEIRLMGPGRLEREEPWFEPVSAAEALWYRGLLYRGFDETAEGMVEFFYLPTELYEQFPRPPGDTLSADGQAAPVEKMALLRPAAAPEPGMAQVAGSSAVDDLTTCLAMAQNYGLQAEALEWLQPYLLVSQPDRADLLVSLAWEMDHLRQTEDGARATRAAVTWLQKSRESQLRELADAWSSSNWNELCHTPGLRCEGSGWRNEPLLARSALLEMLPRRPEWFHVSDLVATFKETNPDFQRPDGAYDTWYIRDLATDAYLVGFSSWELVEGRLLRFYLSGPLSWLGLVETAAGRNGPLFRVTPWALAWLGNQTISALAEDAVPIVVEAGATIQVPLESGCYQRFQVARIAEAAPVRPDQPFLYHLTPRSLSRADGQGISPERALAFLEKASGQPAPPGVKRAVERWRKLGVEARLEQVVILRVRQAEVLEKLRANPKTRPFLGESLGDLAAAVRPDEWQRLKEAAAELGLLLDESARLAG